MSQAPTSLPTDRDDAPAVVPMSAGSPVLPDHPGVFRTFDAGATLVFRTPLQEHPPAADTKAAAILTGFGLMFTILGRFGEVFSTELFATGNERWLLIFLLMAFTGMSFIAIVQAFRTLIPRFPPAPPSLAFFGDIAKLSLEEYVARVEAISEEDALEEMLKYNHTLSTIIVTKFTNLKLGIKYIRAAFACWIVLIFLINAGMRF